MAWRICVILAGLFCPLVAGASDWAQAPGGMQGRGVTCGKARAPDNGKAPARATGAGTGASMPATAARPQMAGSEQPAARRAASSSSTAATEFSARERQHLNTGAARARIDLATSDLTATDLDRDGDRDAIVMSHSPAWCGTGGCTLWIQENTGDGFVMRGSFPTSQGFAQADTYTNGWRDIHLFNSGGGAPPAVDTLTFDGTQYVVSATREVEEMAKSLVRSTEAFMQDGHSLRVESRRPGAQCTHCHVVVLAFDHYGDPCHIYRTRVRVCGTTVDMIDWHILPRPDATDPVCKL